MNTQPFATIPGVKYPAPPRQRQQLPPGCPKYVANLAQLAPWVQAAGLWSTPPSRSTLMRWKKYGLIATRKGATGVQLIDVAATLALLTPKNQ